MKDALRVTAETLVLHLIPKWLNDEAEKQGTNFSQEAVNGG